MHPVLAAWAPPAPFPALRADPVQLYPVAPHDEAEKTSDAFLQPLIHSARSSLGPDAAARAEGDGREAGYDVVLGEVEAWLKRNR